MNDYTYFMDLIVNMREVGDELVHKHRFCANLDEYRRGVNTVYNVMMNDISTAYRMGHDHFYFDPVCQYKKEIAWEANADEPVERMNGSIDMYKELIGFFEKRK